MIENMSSVDAASRFATTDAIACILAFIAVVTVIAAIRWTKGKNGDNDG